LQRGEARRAADDPAAQRRSSRMQDGGNLIWLPAICAGVGNTPNPNIRPRLAAQIDCYRR